MIYRQSSQVLTVHDYGREPGLKPYFGLSGVRVGEGYRYAAQETYVLDAPVVGFELKSGKLTVAGTELAIGNHLLVRRSDDTLELYTAGTLVSTKPAGTPGDVIVAANTVLAFFLRSGTPATSLDNVPTGWSFRGVPAVSGNVSLELRLPRAQGPHILRNAGGGITEQTEGEMYPGDALFYTPPDYNPSRNGNGYASTVLPASGAGTDLMGLVQTIDTAMVSGGLLRQGTLPMALARPSSSTPLELCTLTYRLDDGGPPLDIGLMLKAGHTDTLIQLSVDGRVQTISLRDRLHAHGNPAGLALASGIQGATGLNLERTPALEVFLVQLGAVTPTADVRDSTLTWSAYTLPYVVPGGTGVLSDRTFKVRRTGGPYLFNLSGIVAHARNLVFAGSDDVVSDEFVGMVVEGRVTNYAVVGVSLFDTRHALLLRAN